MADETREPITTANDADNAPQSHGANNDKADDAAETARDPVCGMMVDPHTTEHRSAHDGRPFYFCSAECHTNFDADPEKYLAPIALQTQEPVPHFAPHVLTTDNTQRYYRHPRSPPVAPDHEEPHPTGKLLPARRTRSSD